MKIMTIMGTRPEIIRLCKIIPALDALCEHILVFTGQNYDRTLSDIFFEELRVRLPNYRLQCKASSPMQEIGKILEECERVMLKEKPDKLLLLGDTNSALSAIVAKRLGIPIYHMEAGNRCYDDRVPEEVNRRIIDHTSDILLPYTERSRANLLKEGIKSDRIYVTGNPINEVIDHFTPEIKASTVLKDLKIKRKKYFVVTLHRAENVDVPDRLNNFITAFNLIQKEYKTPIICSLHPRTRSQLKKQNKILNKGQIRTLEPLGLFDFIHLEQNATCVLTDSGTVQEECCIFKIPNVTLRDVTERPETQEIGSNLLSGSDPESIIACVRSVLKQPVNWNPPPEYLVKDVSNTVIKILLSYRKSIVK